MTLTCLVISRVQFWCPWELGLEMQEWAANVLDVSFPGAGVFAQARTACECACEWEVTGMLSRGSTVSTENVSRTLIGAFISIFLYAVIVGLSNAKLQ